MKKLIYMYKNSKAYLFFQNSWLSLILAMITLPIMTRSVSELRNNISTGQIALDISYYQRIFSINDSYILGNFYIDKLDFRERVVDFYNVGEMLGRLGFKFFESNIIFTYLFFSLVYLFLWINLLSRIITYENSTNNHKPAVVSLAVIVFFFSNFSAFTGLYPFARIINPQFSIVLWLIGFLILVKMLDSLLNNASINLQLLFFSGVILVSSLSYIFIFISLLSTSAVFMIYLLLRKHFRNGCKLAVAIVFSIIPYFLITLKNRNEKEFLDLSERMGLIKSRLPGAALTILCGFIIFIAIFCRYYFSSRSKYEIHIVEKVLMLTTLGVVGGSQSNILTNSSIQFSDHFLIFIVSNLMILIGLYFVKYEIRNRLIKSRSLSILTLSTLIIVSISKTFIPALQFSSDIGLYKTLQNKFSFNTNLIVDTDTSNAFPIYSQGKMLYQNDIYTYKYSNSELIERFYISKGCPTDLDIAKLSPVLVYRVEAYEQKAISVQRYLRLIRLDEIFPQFYKPLFTKAANRKIAIEEEIKNFLFENSKKSCIDLARSYNVDFILFDKSSLWNDQLKNYKNEFQALNSYNLLEFNRILAPQVNFQDRKI